NPRDLCDVGLGIPVNLFPAQDWTSLVAPGGITHSRGVITDDQNRFMSPLLELPNDRQRHDMPQRHIRRGWVHAKLNPQRFAGLSAALHFPAKVLLIEDLLAPPREGLDLVVDGNAHKSPRQLTPSPGTP